MHSTRPRLTPAIADVRRAVRGAIHSAFPAPAPEPVEGSVPHTVPELVEGPEPTTAVPAPEPVEGRPLLLVALSGGPDSLALAGALAFEAPRASLRAGAVVVDHGLQAGSEAVAAEAARQAEQLGLAPVTVVRAEVGQRGGPEAAARDARYAAITEAATRLGADAVLLGHTLDDQAETVLLGLARGSGATSLQGMAAVSTRVSPATSGSDAIVFVRPLLGIRRATTVQFCADSGLQAWSDPHNSDPAYARVRVRRTVLPALEAELGPGVAEALARTAEHLREDSAALDQFAAELIEDLVEHAEAGLSLNVRGLEANPAALRQRIIRLAVSSEFGLSLSREHTLEVARLVTDWRGQGPLTLPGVRVNREDGLIVFSAVPIVED